jgi:hypothetical protein
MARPPVLSKPRPVQFFAEAEAHKKAVAVLRAMNRQNKARPRLTITDYLRACLDDLAEGRVKLATDEPEREEK